MLTVGYLRSKVYNLYNNMFHNMCREEKTRYWNVCDIFSKGPITKYKYVVMILNRPLPNNFNSNFILDLWRKAYLRITVDGGSNCWFSWLKLNSLDQKKDFAPDLITGDMDSITDEVLQHFMSSSKRPRVIKTPDQSETDFTKALREVCHYIRSENVEIDTVIVFADTSGRFDHVLANINTLFKAQKILPGVNVLLLGTESFTWLLTENIKHSIDIPLNLRQNREWCALVPIGTPCKVTTTGLKWNLNNTTIQFGNLVSTSNTYNEDSCVTVQTDQPVVWSMGIQSLL